MGLIWTLIFSALTVIPFWRLLPKYGFSEKLALLAIIPVGALILLWMIAFRDEFFGKGER